MTRSFLLACAAASAFAAAGCGRSLPYVEIVPGPPKSSLAGSAAADPTYRLQPEDGIGIAVFDHPEASGPQVVGRDGTIAFPLLGPVPVQGKTASELRQDLVKRYGAFIKQPDLSVTVTAAHGLKVFLLGEVFRPGVLALAGGSRLTQALSEAGGYTDHGDTSGMVIMRETEDGKMQRIHVDVRDIVERGRHEQDIQLQPGDMIHVPRKPYPVGWQDWLIVINAIFLVTNITVATLNLVQRK